MARQFRDFVGLVRSRFRSDRRQVDKRAQWKQRLKAAAIRQRPGLVKVDPKLSRQITAFLEQVAPETSRAFNRHLVPLAEETFQRWPVDTGFSRSLLALSFRPVDGGAAFQGEIRDDAPYAGFIQRGFLARTLFKRGEQVAERMAQDLARNVGR
jgi:hypothetical protein